MNEDLIAEASKRSEKFNKKVEVAAKLKKLGVVAAMTASTALNANAQDNVIDILPHDVNQNSFVINNDDAGLSFNHYQKLKEGQYGYNEAQQAAEFVRAHPEGVYSLDMVKKSAREDYASTLAMTKSREEFEANIGIGSISTNGAVYPKTEEAAKAIEKSEKDALISKSAEIDVDVTFLTINAILKDSNIADEKKEDLIYKESNAFFDRVEEGKYDRGNNNDRYLVKRNYLRLLQKVNPQIATTLAAEQKVDMRMLHPQALQR